MRKVPMVEVSAANIKESTFVSAINGHLSDDLIIYIKDEYGFFLLVDLEAEYDCIPDDLRKIIESCPHETEWILFDVDINPDWTLPVYIGDKQQYKNKTDD